MPPTTVQTLPEEIRELEHTWIPMADGCRLAARLWLPVSADAAPVPALLEYIPYGKRDGTRERDEAMHRYFAGHGYVAARVDLRGCGESDGLLRDEYQQQELDDGLAVIAWLAAQPWCDGSVGMIGKSWGGFNALQLAALQPPALRAVIAVCAADDRYADDAHYMGGCLLNENQTWGSVLFTLGALPPDPALVGDSWRSTWQQRLEHTRPYPLVWLGHQRRDHYWQHGSVCEDFSRIRCPVYAVSGWADGYTNAVPRLLANLPAPSKGLVGPWGHLYPHDGRPGPAIGFLHETLRWWDCWLKGQDTGIMAESRYRAWMPAAGPTPPPRVDRPGRWVAEDSWPSSRTRWLSLHLAAGELAAEPGVSTDISFSSPQSTGLAAGSWCAFGYQGEMPLDQREDDGKSCCFDAAPVADTVEFLGAPVLRLRLAGDQSTGFVVARLCDVAPDGASTRISYGVLNLCHRHGHGQPEPIPVHTAMDVRLVLNDCAWALAPGHRLRLALSTAYWPLVWPSAQAVTLTLQPEPGCCVLELPQRPPRASDADLPAFPPPEQAAVDPVQDVQVVPSSRAIVRDVGTGSTLYLNRSYMDDSGEVSLWHTASTGLTTGNGIEERFEIVSGDPLSATAEIRHIALARRNGWSTSVRTSIRFHASSSAFHVQAELVAMDMSDGREQLVFERSWDQSVPRDGV